tara:strand:- start:25 stop:300 length:276 start_codon:yes stop_codon:yes gene_type:complete
MSNKETKNRKQRATNLVRLIDWPDFVQAWQTSSSCGEVAEKLGRPNNQKERTYVSVKAGYARKRGVPLKKFVRTKSSNDWDELAELAKSLS